MQARYTPFRLLLSSFPTARVAATLAPTPISSTRSKRNAADVGWTVAALAAGMLAAGGLSMASHAAAQPSLALEQFQLAETAEDGFVLSRPIHRGHLKFGLNLALSYANDPLVFEQVRGSRASESFSVVEHHFTGHFMFSLGLWKRLVVFAGMPTNFIMDGDDGAAAAAGVPIADSDINVGDPRFGARIHLYGENDSLFGLGLQVAASAPLSQAIHSEQRYSGEQNFVF
ncbi:MAG: hypothetical protein ACPGUV_14665, partial [Polyangiales bacterium]